MTVNIQIRYRVPQRPACLRKAGVLAGGKAVVRLALTILMFLGTTIGGLEIGNAVWTYSTVVRAANLGARYAELHAAAADGAVVNRDSVSREIENIVRDNVGDLSRKALTVDTAWPPAGASEAPVRVRVAYSQRFFASSLTFAGEGFGIPAPRYEVAVTN